MGQLVFQANSGGQTNLVGQNTASTFNLNIPLANGTLVSTGDTGTVTNTMLAGSITNAKLVNSSVTIGSTSVALGATSTTLDGVNIGATTPGTGAFTTFSASSTATFSGGTANGVAYLNGSKVLTTGSALTFDGTNLGVGVSSPVSKLHVNNFSTATTAITIGNNNGGTQIGFDSSNTSFVSAYTNNALRFGYNSSSTFVETGRFDASGNWLVGTTSSPSGSGNIVAPTIYSNTTASVSYVAVSSSGLLQRGGVSAAKYKQDIRDLELIDIDQFKPVRYKSKCATDDQTIDHFGFIADDFDKAGIKELVIYDKNGEVEGFAYDKLTAVLTKELQSLRARVAQLEAQKG